MPVLPTDANDSPNYTPAQHATHHNVLAGINNELGNFVQSASEPGSPADGDLWLDTDEDAQSGTSASPVVIAEQTLASAATFIEFSGIPATYKHLLVEGRMRSDRSGATTDVVYMRVGSGGSVDTAGTSYRFIITDKMTADTNSTSGAQIQIGRCPGATADADVFGSFEVKIQDYLTTTYWRWFKGETMIHESGSAFNYTVAHAAWKNKANAIDVIRFFPATGPNFIAGSQLRLIGIPAP